MTRAFVVIDTKITKERYYVFSQNRNRAKYIVAKSAMEAGYKPATLFNSLRVRLWKQFPPDFATLGKLVVDKMYTKEALISIGFNKEIFEKEDFVKVPRALLNTAIAYMIGHPDSEDVEFEIEQLKEISQS